MDRQSDTKYHVCQRLSLKHQLCTVRYIGPVTGKSGTWLGVEWDQAERGKHDGMHDGVRYFHCVNKSAATPASFLKQTTQWDQELSFLKALHQKYMSTEHDNATANSPAAEVFFSSKQAEKIGFDKFARRQAQLLGIHVLILDSLRIRLSAALEDEAMAISSTCAHITDLDISRNLIEDFDEVLRICHLLPKLRNLTLDGTRLSTRQNMSEEIWADGCCTLQSLSLSDTLLEWPEILTITALAPNLKTLVAASNGIDYISVGILPTAITTLDLSDNGFTALTQLEPLRHCSNLQALILKGNKISCIDPSSSSDTTQFFLSSNTSTIDLASNKIASWSFLDALPHTLPALKNLRVTNNPLYSNLQSPTPPYRSLTSADGSMLTIARLPTLQTLNYTPITDKDRLNAETYYLSQIAAELSKTPALQRDSLLLSHPRYPALCATYGEPSLTPTSSYRNPTHSQNPNDLSSRLVELEIYTSPLQLPLQSWSVEIPKSLSTYWLIGTTAARLEVNPLRVRLIWETNERDPVAARNIDYAGPEWWDSSDESENEKEITRHDEDWVKREVILVPGTRALGTYFDVAPRARVRVELLE